MSNGKVIAPPVKKNGENLPADRIAAVEQGLHLYHQVAAERDQLRIEVQNADRETIRSKLELEARITQDEVEIEALRALVNTLESRVRSHQLERDQAISDRAIYETLFISIQAQLRAFSVPNTPLVKQLADEKQLQTEINEGVGRLSEDEEHAEYGETIMGPSAAVEEEPKR